MIVSFWRGLFVQVQVSKEQFSNTKEHIKICSSFLGIETLRWFCPHGKTCDSLKSSSSSWEKPWDKSWDIILNALRDHSQDKFWWKKSEDVNMTHLYGLSIYKDRCYIHKPRCYIHKYIGLWHARNYITYAQVHTYIQFRKIRMDHLLMDPLLSKQA